MLRYFHFLSKTYFKKWSPYINMLFGIATFALMIIPSIMTNGYGDSPSATVNSISPYNKFFPFLFGTLFSALSINHIFKEGELDGSELIVVAKPLTRMQIIVTKFLMLFTVIIMYQIVACISYAIIASQDPIATSTDKINWIMSLTVGGLIVQIIAASVIVIISAVLGKVGTTVVSILFAAMIPIISFTIVPLGKGAPYDMMQKPNSQSIALRYNSDGNSLSNVIPDDDNSYILPLSTNIYNDYRKQQWYDKAAYADVWYQWGRFYSMFMDNRNGTSLVQDWHYKEVTVKKGNSLTVHVGTKDYVIALSGGISEEVAPHMGTLAHDFKNQIKDIKDNASKKSALEANTSLEARLLYISNNILHSPVQNVTDINNINISDQIKAILFEQQVEEQIPSLVKAATLGTSIVNRNADSNDKTTGKLWVGTNDTISLYRVGDKVMAIVPEDFIPTTGVVGGWAVIAVLLVGLSVFVYFRRDFK